ncbi:ABC transporter ATP-binding protein [Thermodesulfobacteriota bacterium B35]
MLMVTDITAWHGSAQILFGVSLVVRPGEVVALMGRNGMGKSTLIRALMGLCRIRSGSVTWQGREIHRLPPYRIARLGIGLVPEGRQVFPTLTVRENLLAVAANYGQLEEPFTLEHVFALFPRLAERPGHLGRELSGGEQQMLAIARALMINPRLLLLDEAGEGLAPLVREEIWQGLDHLRRRGLAILVVDRDIDALLRISDRLLFMEKGSIVWQDEHPFPCLDSSVKLRYLGV